MEVQPGNKMRLYHATVIFSVLFALVGFSYNVWRMEVTEQNSNIRTAGFEILLELASLEQLVYTAHYDRDLDEGSPRKGWVMVGLISDLSELTDDSVERQAAGLKQVWSQNWESMAQDRGSVDRIVDAIDAVREDVKRLTRSLD